MPSMRVAMIGYGFMGAAHSQGWRVAPRFFDLPADPQMALVVGRNADAVAAAAAKWGWEESATDWRSTLERDDIDLVDIVTPGSSHAEIAIAALEAGKHVLCEKPLANTVAEAEAMADAAARAAERGVFAMVGFTYRRVPATTFARQLVAEGRIGRVTQVRASYRQDWLVDPQVPLAWRLRKELAGSGALGDIGAHAIDLAQFITGQRLESVSGTLETIVKERPLPADTSPGEVASLGEPPARAPARSPSTTSRCSRAASIRVCSAASRRPGSPPAARTRCGSRCRAPRGRSPSIWKTSTPSSSTTAPRRMTARASRGSS
ncbi:hypothetical protein GCM10025869_07300 [Homoserinibacter gongjuensis]|uniref:Gfo/Idh/MocA family oxidoreductase n=1 Tax=Homoserinibacter gongjuensis TaxID=1162968 RepID=A0ABQ6JU54_9MICO|nr:hypothetical protein GCM10025869_07300 [Homoserinibacter gongjuensis]